MSSIFTISSDELVYLNFMENYYIFCEFCQYYSKVLGYQLKSFGFQSDRANIII